MTYDSDKTTAPNPISGIGCPSCGGGWVDDQCTDNDGCAELIDLVVEVIDPHVMADHGQLRDAAIDVIRTVRQGC